MRLLAGAFVTPWEVSLASELLTNLKQTHHDLSSPPPKKGSLMKKTLAVLSVVGLSAVGLTASASSPAVSSSKDTVTFTVTEHVTHETGVNVNRRGPVGDEYIFTSRLSIQGDPVGRAQGVCTVVSRHASQCDVTAVFNPVKMKLTSAKSADNIQLTVSGSVNDAPGDFTLAVTGGTNLFEGANGQVTVHTLSNTRDRLFFELIQPAVA
jgi:hypothetical protein